ncbi:hypothetical protein VKT23_016541 [Stygiomarasmius scandens]|uniref:Ubiquitin domain-containing protein DSK2 n=1 Tax=Marasmiellus scandens TaxID=2682957 RepID=A0ABR1IUR8_9AGAR
MADEGSSSANEIQINIKGPNELKLTISISTDKNVSELKQLIATKSDVPADRQRLIYSGRVLKDEDALSQYKIQSSHTIHMVKGAAKSPSTPSTSSPSSTAGTGSAARSQPLPTMQTGLNPHDPLTALNGHQGFGLMAGFNPFADMGVNQSDPNMFANLMNSPEFLQQMGSMMQNPAIVDQIIAMNPQFRGMEDQVRGMFQSETFRNIMSNPQALQAMMQMSQALHGSGGGAGSPFGGFGGGFGGGASSFPAPGVPGSTPSNNDTSNANSGSTGGDAARSDAGAGTGTGTGAGTAPNPFAMLNNPAAMAQMQQLLGAMNVGGTGGQQGQGQGQGQGAPNPWANLGALGGLGAFGGGMGGFGGAPAAPADTRPPEERFQVQLQQLTDMGFTNASQNIRALLATGGNVHSAIEYILGGGGL